MKIFKLELLILVCALTCAVHAQDINQKHIDSIGEQINSQIKEMRLIADTSLDNSLSRKLNELHTWSFNLYIYQTLVNTLDTFPQIKGAIYATPTHTDYTDEFESIRLRNDSVWYINHENGCFSCGLSNEIDTTNNISPFFYIADRIRIWDAYSIFWYKYPDVNSNTATMRVYDTVRNNQRFKVLEKYMCKSLIWDSNKNDWIPKSDTIFFYVDSTSFWVKEVEIHSSYFWEYQMHYVISNIRENCPCPNETIFDKNNKKYEDYEEYPLPNKIPPSLVRIENSENSNTMSMEVADFPLVNCNNDTLRLKDTACWKLLYFWNYHCGVCLEHFHDLQHEKSSHGYRFLEKNGISMFCINYMTSNTAKFKEISNRYDMADISYAARDMNCIPIPYTPYYLLYAPNGDLVFQGQPRTEKDLIKAKNRYEKRHRKH